MCRLKCLKNCYTLYVDAIKIYHRDASWELEPNVFEDQLKRHNTCDANDCLCPYPENRKYNEEE